ncbi:hypothetical protein TIFTF001_000413 [Ficus carica]|uniref:Cytochrome P450 n=1 Tax=Ficus carica TaxID=3494 RepID=A0AA88D1A4_FICCA|nr:hypothetical protein TIFTF001_000413 [Ficus carica]
MISSPEAARIVLVSRAHLFRPTYPPSKEKIIGPEALFFHQGAYHSRVKKLVQASFLPSALRGSVSEIENIVLRLLATWKDTSINTLQEMKKFAFDVAVISVFGNKPDIEMEGIKHLWLIGCTRFLENVDREQEGIRSKLLEENRGLTWEDTRRMPLTSRVFQETLRRASILSFTFREAVEDVEFEGYVIPKVLMIELGHEYGISFERLVRYACYVKYSPLTSWRATEIDWWSSFSNDSSLGCGTFVLELWSFNLSTLTRASGATCQAYRL